MRTCIAAAVVAASIVLCPSRSAAQGVAGPQIGDWGGETSFRGGATVLRFRGPESAWLLGWSASIRDDQDESTAFGPATSSTSGFVDVSVGLRRYRRIESPIRPFTAWGLSAGFRNASLGDTWDVGPFYEMGAAYLFSEHVMLGVAGRVSLVYRHADGTAVAPERRTLEFNVLSPNVLLTIYF